MAAFKAIDSMTEPVDSIERIDEDRRVVRSQEEVRFRGKGEGRELQRDRVVWDL